VDHADADSNLVQEGQLLGEQQQILTVLRYLAGKFDNESLPLKSPDVWEGFAQEIE
jgi:hypothetical protein